MSSYLFVRIDLVDLQIGSYGGGGVLGGANSTNPIILALLNFYGSSNVGVGAT